MLSRKVFQKLAGGVKVPQKQPQFLGVEFYRGFRAAFDTVVPEVIFKNFR